jgi:3-oxoacyl-[acyl-carrier-protein] synthase-3
MPARRANLTRPGGLTEGKPMPYAHITGWGRSVPDTILTNDELAQRVDTSDKWIRDMTGIRERRIARDREYPSTLAVKASIDALNVANLKPTDIDLIICATSSPEYIFPATACLIQDQLGATRAGAFDLSAACTGFIFAANMAAHSIRAPD